MKIMLDTNVIISLLIFDSKPLKQMMEIITNKYKIVLCSYVVDELYEVVNRKFINKNSDLTEFLFSLPFEMYITPKEVKSNFEIRDVNDIPVLYSAIKSGASILITGDKDFYDISIKGLEILSPTEFLNKYF